MTPFSWFLFWYGRAVYLLLIIVSTATGYMSITYLILAAPKVAGMTAKCIANWCVYQIALKLSKLVAIREITVSVLFFKCQFCAWMLFLYRATWHYSPTIWLNTVALIHSLLLLLRYRTEIIAQVATAVSHYFWRKARGTSILESLYLFGRWVDDMRL